MNFRTFVSAAAAVVILGVASAANAQVFQPTAVTGTGCTSGAFDFSITLTGFDGGAYNIRTVATSGGLTYMNENASFGALSDGVRSWSLFDIFSYGPVASPGTWPIPAGQPVTIDFSVERPLGTVLSSWRTVIDGCDTGVITSNAPLPPPATVPTMSEWAMILFSLMLAGGAAVMIQRRRLA